MSDGPADPGKADELLPSAYDELRTLAEALLQQRRPPGVVQTTSLIQDAYIRLVQGGLRFNSRAHFLGVAAKAMRCVLIDRARLNGAQKRGEGKAPVSLDQVTLVDGKTDVLAIDEVLTRLAELDPRKARIVELRFFGGLSVEETGEAMGFSPATVKREWALAKAWLFRELEG